MPTALLTTPQPAGARVGLSSGGGEPPDRYPTREQDDVFDALALEHDQVIVERTSTRRASQCYLATCVTPGQASITYAVYPSGLRVQRP